MNQIYQEYHDCLMPRLGFTRLVSKTHFALMFWPNGKPCALINFWLTDLSSRTTGKTIKQYAVWLTPYVRYCYDNKVRLVDFSDEDMASLVKAVSSEEVRGRRVKENNSVNLMVDSVVAFLTWIQSEGNPTDHRGLVGLAADAPNLEVKVHSSSSGRSVAKHIFRLPKSTPDHSKVPMPRDIIAQIENEIFVESDPCTWMGLQSHKFNSGSERMLSLQCYLYERRAFSLWLFKRTGLRTEELSSMPLSDNLDVATTLVIWLPTKKRRTDGLSLRPFKLTAHGALTVKYYIDARETYLQDLRRRGLSVLHVNKMLLTEDGTFLSAGAITRDFSRVVKRAGLDDVRACLSMFRHRFITMEIMVHMKEVLATDKPTRGMLNDAVIKSIEERVRKKTGHKLGESIWHYFDAAFDMMKFWGGVDKTLINAQHLDDVEDKAKRLEYRLRNSPDEVKAIAEELAALRREMSELRTQLGVAT